MHKIALNAFGRIGRILITKNNNIKINPYNRSLVSVQLFKNFDNKALIKSYNAVKRKYYPEKDLILKT